MSPFGFSIPITDPTSVFHRSACDRPNKNIVTVFIASFKSLIFHILKVEPINKMLKKNKKNKKIEEK